MTRLREANLQLQPDKCQFLRREVGYLGHIIGEDGVKPDPAKIEAVKEFPTPKNPKNIKQFLGLAGYYRRFIRDFAKIAKPLTNLLKKNTAFEWGFEQNKAFDKLRTALCSEPILQYPDFTKPFILTTDASGYAVGAVLSQGDIGKDLPIAYTSRSLNGAEKNYSTIEKELLAIIYAVNHFRSYLYGRKFTLVTDHRPLVWLHSVKDPTSRLLRWKFKLNEYEYDVIYKAGRINLNADALSRNPIEKQILPFLANNNLGNHNGKDFIPFTQEEMVLPLAETITVEALVHRANEDPPLRRSERIRSRTTAPTYNDVDPYSEEEAPHPRKPKRIDKYHRDANWAPSSYERRKLIKEDENQRKTTNAPLHQDSLTTTPREGEISSTSSGIQPENRPKTGSQDPKSSTVPQNRLNLQGSSTNTYLKSDNNAIEHRDLIPTTSSSDEEPESETDDSDETESEIEEPPIKLNANDDINLPIADKPQILDSITSKSKIVRIRDNITLCKNNIVCFVTWSGEPADEGSRRLHEKDRLPPVLEGDEGSVLTSREGKYFLFRLVLPSKNPTTSEINKLLGLLQQKINELNVKHLNISFSREIAGLPWQIIQNLFRIHFAESNITISVCENQIIEPPVESRYNIIQEYHDTPLGGHKGVNKTYHRIRQDYYWNTLKFDIQAYIQACTSCQKKKLTRIKTKQPMLITDTPLKPFDKVSMDIMGPLPQTSKGNEYILTIQDDLTKHLTAIPLMETSSKTIAQALIKNFICRHGTPKAILTDQGANLTSAVMKSVAKHFRIKTLQTTAFHPQSNGSVERSHHVLTEYLKHYIDKKNEWDEWLELASFSYNTSRHEGTTFTPHELLYGTPARYPSSFPLIEGSFRTYNDYLTDLVENLEEKHAEARDRLIRSKEKSKTYYDRKVHPETLRVGDQVFLLKGKRKGKLDDQYTGPHQVLQITDKGNVEIQISPKKTRLVHPNRLKRAKTHLQDG